MKIICTTSDKYLHLIPIFCYLFTKYWGNDPVEIVGYKKPKCKLPENFTFHSMGEQGDVKEWSTDLRRYFKNQDEWFIWLMEDTFIKRKLEFNIPLIKGIGRVGLTNDIQKRGHSIVGDYVYADNNSLYRLSTQPSIWNKEFLLKYLINGLTPWQFETQNPVNDGYAILGLANPPVKHNEGVRKHDPHKLDLNGFELSDIYYIKNTL